ncbi:MAG: hypothetical protein R3C99_24850 [Pirellulaceae bacterium]
MIGIWQVLAEFIFRVTFGVSLAMAATPARLVTAGFYRVHLWVLMGLNTFAALIVFSMHDSFVDVKADWRMTFGLAVALAVISYVGAVVWLYEQRGLGFYVLVAVSGLGLIAGASAAAWDPLIGNVGVLLALLDLVAGGLLLGVTLSGMFLGHWYLNTPGMDLVPLKRLVLLMFAAVLLRTAVSGTGFVLQMSHGPPAQFMFWTLLAFRWLSGVLGTLAMAWLAWNTLKVPNTQSATGILYAGVILAFLGELVSQLLSVGLLYPV